MTAGEIALIIAVGAATGVFSGLMGVGGGLLMVPAMVLLLGYDQHFAEGTSLLVIIPTAAVAAYAHYRNGYLHFRRAIALAAGGIAGAVVGSHSALVLGGEVLRDLFIAYLILTGLGMVLPGSVRSRWPSRRRRRDVV